MAVSIKLNKLSSHSLLRNKGLLYTATRWFADDKPAPWNYLWEPRKYSKEKHNKIAEKYHLHPKDYKPASEDQCIGDYPDLPMIGSTAKDPYYPYDIPVFRKNYHETVHHQFDIMTEDRFDFGYKFRIDVGLAALISVGVITGLVGFTYLVNSYPHFQPLMEKQYPSANKTHYTFEPAEK